MAGRKKGNKNRRSTHTFFHYAKCADSPKFALIVTFAVSSTLVAFIMLTPFTRRNLPYGWDTPKYVYLMEHVGTSLAGSPESAFIVYLLFLNSFIGSAINTLKIVPVSLMVIYLISVAFFARTSYSQLATCIGMLFSAVSLNMLRLSVDLYPNLLAYSFTLLSFAVFLKTQNLKRLFILSLIPVLIFFTHPMMYSLHFAALVVYFSMYCLRARTNSSIEGKRLIVYLGTSVPIAIAMLLTSYSNIPSQVIATIVEHGCEGPWNRLIINQPENLLFVFLAIFTLPFLLLNGLKTLGKSQLLLSSYMLVTLLSSAIVPPLLGWRLFYVTPFHIVSAIGLSYLLRNLGTSNVH